MGLLTFNTQLSFFNLQKETDDTDLPPVCVVRYIPIYADMCRYIPIYIAVYSFFNLQKETDDADLPLVSAVRHTDIFRYIPI